MLEVILRRHHILASVVVVGLLSMVAVAQVEVTAEKGYLRSTVEAYPLAKRRPLVEYMNAAKSNADKAAQLLADGNVTQLYELMLPLFKKQVTLEEFGQIIASLETTEGKIVSYRYRNQALLYPDDSTTSVSDLNKAESVVYYSVTTTKSKGDKVFLIVRTFRDGNQHLLVKINFQDYSSNMPAWLLPRTKASYKLKPKSR